MNTVEFIASSNVCAFTDWLAKNYASLSTQLQIKRSRFARGGIQIDRVGQDLLQHYRWRTTKSAKDGDWQETRNYLRKLGDPLKQAIQSDNQDMALGASNEILAWGGNRNDAKGARPFRDGLHAERTLIKYLKTSSSDFRLEVAVIDARKLQAAKVNTRLTKVHALASTMACLCMIHGSQRRLLRSSNYGAARAARLAKRSRQNWPFQRYRPNARWAGCSIMRSASPCCRTRLLQVLQRQPTGAVRRSGLGG